jgi:hypothetical protein
MPGRTNQKRKTSLAISDESRQLLAIMSEKSGISQSAVLELAIRERAQREKISLLEDAPAAAATERGLPQGALRQLAEQARAGDEAAAEEMRRVIAGLQESPTALCDTSKLSEEEREARRERFTRLAEQIRGGVPEEWTPEEIEHRVEQLVTTVRQERRACNR